MMGEDPEHFSQDSIQAALRYLMPSGLHNIGARPRLQPPDKTFPKKKSLLVDTTGRPLQHLFYTGKPNFYTILHEASQHLESMNRKLDNHFYSNDNTLLKDEKPLQLLASEWFSHADLEKETMEKIKPHLYENWLALMNLLVDHKLAFLAEEFIMKYRNNVTKSKVVGVNVLPQPDSDNPDRQYVTTYGQKKRSLASVKLFHPGTGLITVNNRSLLEVFPEISNREQIMFPLALTNCLTSLDIDAQVSGPQLASSSKANALRLAIARGLVCFQAELDPQKSLEDRLLTAGLLVQDDRMKERKKPGQPKARKKPIWKAR
ncbi:hypothetical protein Ciccas_010206 [Cichlidogyrus casuarinus]|uniref:28S ribosomal protein S9, mitochondrial n=1 Tax=Cichlidogyrus casuarinus TaxID=1844966 RepID=A0ABD2PWQ6_9PLAT